MMTFLRILFFAQTVLINPKPIDLFGEVELELQNSLSAITTGASIEIDVSSMVGKSKQEGIIDLRRKTRKEFPPGTIEATLISKDKQRVVLRYNGASAHSDQQTILILDSDSGVPTHAEFERVIIKSQVKLKSVSFFWKNYKRDVPK